MIHERFKIRASAAGQLMTNSRDRKSMGETAKTYCKNWLLEQPEYFGIRLNEFSSIQTDKGNAVEADALDFISTQLYDGAFFAPNVEHFENDFMSGTPDNMQPDHTLDNKASWTARTFPFFDVELPTKDYWWQGQVYMHLTGRKKHIVYYVLMNTPDWLIDREVVNRSYKLGIQEPTAELYEQVVSEMTYDHIDPKLRIKAFEFDYDPQAITDLIARVCEARQYIKQIHEEIKDEKE